MLGAIDGGVAVLGAVVGEDARGELLGLLLELLPPPPPPPPVCAAATFATLAIRRTERNERIGKPPY